MSDKVHYKAQIRKRFEEKKRRASTIHNVPPQIAHQKGGGQKINLDYIENENQVQNILRTRYQENNFIDSVDIETAFFTDAVQLPPTDTNSNDDGSPGDSARSNASIKTESPEPDSPTHIASSYLQNEEIPVTQTYEPTKFVYNDKELFYAGTELEKVDYDVEKSRNIEEEGIFVPAKPTVKPSNRCLLINRLIEDGSFHCLHNDNNLLDMRYFHEPGSYHSHCSKRFNPIFVPATAILDGNNSEITVPEDKVINIFIEKLYFYNHYLFNEEQMVAKHIESLYAEYKGRIHKKVIENLHSKLESLRAMSGTYEKYGQQIKLNRNQLHKEEKAERYLLKNLLEQWKRLKLLRERQKCASTTLKIQIVQIDVDETEDAEAWCKRFDTEFDEMVEEAFQDYKRNKETYKARIDGKRDEVMVKPQKPDIEQLKSDLFALYKKTIRGPGEPKLFIELIEDDVDGVVKALHNFEQYKYFLKIVIDNDAVTSTKHCGVDNNFHVDFGAKYSIRLMTKITKNVKIEVSAKM
jgi:coiled-coil and C2 domain-containing protein 2A